MKIMMTIVVASAISALLAAPTPDARSAPEGSQPADDFSTIDGVISALYDVISGPPGPRNWDRFRDLFAEQGRLVATGQRPDGSLAVRHMTPDEYIERSGPTLEGRGFFEREVARRLEAFGPIAHAFSTYESRREADGAPFARGINSIQLLKDGDRWYILSVFWANETETNPLPEKYLPS